MFVYSEAFKICLFSKYICSGFIGAFDLMKGDVPFIFTDSRTKSKNCEKAPSILSLTQSAPHDFKKYYSACAVGGGRIEPDINSVNANDWK